MTQGVSWGAVFWSGITQPRYHAFIKFTDWKSHSLQFLSFSNSNTLSELRYKSDRYWQKVRKINTGYHKIECTQEYQKKYRMTQKIYINGASHIFKISLQKLNGLNEQSPVPGQILRPGCVQSLRRINNSCSFPSGLWTDKVQIHYWFVNHWLQLTYDHNGQVWVFYKSMTKRIAELLQIPLYNSMSNQIFHFKVQCIKQNINIDMT